VSRKQLCLTLHTPLASQLFFPNIRSTLARRTSSRTKYTKSVPHMKRARTDDEAVILIPLTDELAPSMLDAFLEGHKRVTQPKRTIRADDSILASYVSEISAEFRTHIPSTYDYTPIRCIGNVGCKLIWTGKEARINVEIACLIYMLDTMPKHDLNTDLLDWFADVQWLSSQCVCAANLDTGWVGFYAEHRLWKSLALLLGIDIQSPVPSIIRSWFPKELLHFFIESVGEETVRRIVSIVRGPRSQGFFGMPGKYLWNGCPDLVFWNGSQLHFVEVKSSTDTLKEDQIILRDELTSEGFHYTVAITQDASGRRRMKGVGSSKRGRIDHAV